VIDWFKDFHPPDFARAGNIATRAVIIPAGPIMQHHSDPPEPFPHNEEPQLRKLGLHTVMKRGVPSLDNPHTLCEEGKPLTPEQAQLLKLIGEKMVQFEVGMKVYWSEATGEVTTVEGDAASPEERDGGEDEDEEMSS
jgi:mRNA turnover protein 4